VLHHALFYGAARTLSLTHHYDRVTRRNQNPLVLTERALWHTAEQSLRVIIHGMDCERELTYLCEFPDIRLGRAGC
jgi:hypothetical protein